MDLLVVVDSARRIGNTNLFFGSRLIPIPLKATGLTRLNTGVLTVVSSLNRFLERTTSSREAQELVAVFVLSVSYESVGSNSTPS